MPNSSSSPHSHQTHDSQHSLPLNPNPPDPETLTHSHPVPVPDPDPNPKVNSLEDDDDEEEEGEEVDQVHDQENPAVSSGMSPIADSHVSSAQDVTLAALPTDPSTRRGPTKRKKGKGKGKGKPHGKKQQAIEEKVQALMANLNPIPFVPSKIFDFDKHEALLRRMGLRELVQINFDRDIRVDLIAQLVVTYEAKSRASYVNGYRIRVNRADLARALSLPLKKEKGGGGGVDVDLDGEPFSEESIGFIMEFVSDWVLLHEDTWMTPNEVTEWLKLIKEGSPEKVDWAGMFWFMVEKELKQGVKLSDCYYASHLQHLIKSQREDLLLKEEPAAETVELDVEVKEAAEEEKLNEEDAEAKVLVDVPREDSHVMEGPSTELTLGQDGEKVEGITDVNMMDVENCKVSDGEGEGKGEEGGEGEGEGEEQGQWLLDGRNDLGEHFLQPCDTENAEGFSNFEVRKEEDEEEEEEETGEMDGEEEEEEEMENHFSAFPNGHALERDGFTGNLLQGMETNHMPFNAEEQLHSPSSADIRTDMHHFASTHSFMNSTGKRVIEHDDHVSHHHALNESNKRLRINDSWENKPADLGMCLDNIQHWSERARAICEEKDHALEQANLNQQILLNELQKRDDAINMLHKAKMEEVQRKDHEIYRLERELYLMETVVKGYRDALKETQKAFAEYRKKAQLPEEPTYRDTGPGGLMLTAVEIEKLDKKREEESKMNCLILEQKASEAEEGYRCQFEGYYEKLNILDKKLAVLEANAKRIIELHTIQKVPQNDEKMPEVQISQTEEKMLDVVEIPQISQTEEKMLDVVETPQISETEEKMLEVVEPPQISQTEEKMSEVVETPQMPQNEEQRAEGGEPLLTPQVGEKLSEVAEPPQTPQTNKKVTEVEETLPKE